MKTKWYHLLAVCTLVAGMLTTADMAAAIYPAPYILMLRPVFNSPDELPVEPVPGSHGKRTPPAGISCTITPEEGVTIHSQAVSRIISYEIWDAEGTESIAVLSDEQSFTDILYTMEGEYQLRFTTCDQTLIGSNLL